MVHDEVENEGCVFEATHPTVISTWTCTKHFRIKIVHDSE